MSVHHILETCLYCRNLEEAEAFYSAVLGCDVYSMIPGRHVFFKLEAAMLLIFNPDKTMEPNAKMPPHGVYGEGHIAFQVEEGELGKWRKHLKKHNIPIEAEVNWPGGGKSVYFRDPGNNSVELATAKTWDL